MNINLIKGLIIISIFLLSMDTSFAQHDENVDSCYALVIYKKKVNFKDLTPKYHPNGFYLLKNGIYDFMINNKKYYFSRIINIEFDKFQIEKYYTKKDKVRCDTITVQLKVDDIRIRPSSLHNGIAGLSKSMKSNRYHLKIVPKTILCEIPEAKICEDKECLKYTSGYQYFTQIEWKPIYQEKGKQYLIDRSRKHQIVNNVLQ